MKDIENNYVGLFLIMAVLPSIVVAQEEGEGMDVFLHPKNSTASFSQILK